MKLVCSADRITNLPTDAIQRIFVFLPIQDAAKTSVLSRKWRQYWRSTPYLVFDHDYTRIFEEAESESEERSKLIMMNIYKTLLVHEGPITKFVLSIHQLQPYNEINHIVLYLSNKGVQDLSLEICIANREGQKMHNSLFSALSLKSLTLRWFVITPPTWFVGFSKLTHLKLLYVTLPCDFFENFLLKCPMLEHLTVVYCKGLGKVLLKGFEPGTSRFMASGITTRPIPCSFKYLAFDQPVPDICFKYTPLLSYVSLSWCVSRTPGMVALFASLPALQQFYVHYEILRFLAAGVDNASARLPTLHRLKVLGITHLVIDCSEAKFAFACLIMISPNLLRLSVRIKSCPLRDQLTKNKESSSLWGLLEADDCPGSSVCLQHLTEFRIYDGHCTQVELDLVRFILANAPLLKRVIISLAHTLCSEKVMKFIKDMARCKRVSKEAEVIYASDDED